MNEDCSDVQLIVSDSGDFVHDDGIRLFEGQDLRAAITSCSLFRSPFYYLIAAVALLLLRRTSVIALLLRK